MRDGCRCSRSWLAPTPIAVVLLVACSVPDGDPRNSGRIAPEPSTIFFGTVEWGHTAEAELLLWNDSYEDARVEALVLSSDAFVVDDLGPFIVSAHGVVERTVAWTAATLDGVHERIDVFGPGGRFTWIPIEGNTAYGVLSASIESHDFGAVGVGCEPFVDVVLNNAGNVDLVVSFVGTHPSEILVRDTTGLPLETPLSIAPRTNEVVRLVYSPTVVGELDATLELRSNDPIQPSLALRFRGEGLATEPLTSEWTIDRADAVTGIVQVNNSVLDEPFRHRFDDFLPAFFDGLLDLDLPFRVAFVSATDGEVDGPTPYIDDSFASPVAVDVVWDMLVGLESDYNNHGLETCRNALRSNESWLFEETEPWLASKLNLVVISTERERSPGSAGHYVREYGDYKDLARVGVHGIAGDMPAGCVSEGGDAGQSPELWEATDMTGGVYLSICETDWTMTAATMVEAFARYQGGLVYAFPEYPAPESIDVYLDGMEMLTGWWYELASNALVFEQPLPAGSTLRVDYVFVESCW